MNSPKTIAQIIRDRGISEVLHFTTNRGLVGMFASGSVKSRQRLPTDEYIEHIYTENCRVRYDQDWLDYVNLSITDINGRLFGIAKDKWHAAKDLWWCILAFEPAIMTHDGVHFATTNNIYPGVKRLPGADGLEELFAPTIKRWDVLRRTRHLQPFETTCSQAEVLYPGELSLDHLTHIYVATGEHLDQVAAQMGVWDGEIPIQIEPVRFRGRAGRHYGK